jgi:penicillin amidase
LAPSVIERLLREQPEGWFKEGYDDMMVYSLASAVARGTELFGSGISRWNWGAYNRADLRHGVLGGIPLLGRFVNIGPLPMSGSAFSVKQVTDRLAPSFRMVVDFSDLDASLANTTTGQSAQLFSPHYKDQWDAYYYGTGLPMQFQKVTAVETLVVTP